MTDDFSQRHIGPSADDVTDMLKTVGAGSIDELIAETVPPSIRQTMPLDVGPALSETEALERLQTLAGENQIYTSLIGQGYYGTILPSVIQRNILENPAWYTAYTPYQPEISQGRLEALINFQTMVCDLTGLDVANASLLDEATAAAEGMALARRVSTSKSMQFFVDRDAHPQTLAVMATRAEPLNWTLVVGDPQTDLAGGDFFGALFQYPGTYGDVRDLREAINAVHAKGGIAVVAADPLALTLLTPPGELGADVAIGSTQRFGVPMGYGGPHAAYISTRSAHTRALPGRLVGVSVDARQQTAYRLTLQTREQHIRREKATSNICTAEVLLAVMASMYAVYHGPEGLKEIAHGIHQKTSVLAVGLRKLGFPPLNETFFDTITVEAGRQRDAVMARGLAERLNFRIVPAGARGTQAALGISLDETTTPGDVEAVWRAFGGMFHYSQIVSGVKSTLPEPLRRTSAFLAHPVFHRHRSEAGLTRYMRKLADRDLALDRTMIPLGSCTMKLNATTEMLPVTWPEFSLIHPFAPDAQVAGYRRMLDELEAQLCAITGYDAVSLQPNSGAQGEYAGLLAIRAYHRSRGDAGRNVCLIPTSAHGTNPASAHMAGMDVVTVRCDNQGNVEIRDLEDKARKYADRLAAAMVTYPSTHGVFEPGIREFCEIVHRYGGQVYLDGANLNAQVGLCRPGDYGADVSHLNLHKTFCIPHGGGGPGMGPIGVKAHLKPFLPGHPSRGLASPVGPVSAAPYGSPSILPIAYTYILMMGGAGLRRATEVAILAANYIAARLDPHFPVLYKNAKGRVAHECIVDPRSLQDSAGVTAEDIAKRLMDYGFHAPTMSFPVAGTLMIEPTESEPLAELDRFCDAMISIRNEIRKVEAGQYGIADSPLRRAPHTARDLADDEWGRPYTRSEACFPGNQTPGEKYWPPVNRIDNVYGDRNLFCSCPPLDN
ncbi:MAG TPA: aminomethyl-transferring glycine dehydrogenase [Terriglobia bacterium]|nr:aminomethyl-transferring glycine dehydrogenase [Terriglobia bacterium]